MVIKLFATKVQAKETIKRLIFDTSSIQLKAGTLFPIYLIFSVFLKRSPNSINLFGNE